MNRKKRIYIAIGGSILVLLAVLSAVAYSYYSRHVEESPLYLTVSHYQKGAQEWNDLQDAAFAEESGEGLFLQGMDAFASGDYDRAKTFFEEALEAQSSDPALPAYLYYYINQCIFLKDGSGSYDVVFQALEAASEYAPLANDTDMLWDLVSSISLSTESDKTAITLMQDYLQSTESLNLETWAWLKNCIAMLEYNNEEYAKSIREFYDVELALENAQMTPALEIELRYAKEYIANIYFIFEDYMTAATLYQELINSISEESTFHGYGCCINMASAYLEVSDTENARKAMKILEENLPRVEADIALEVEASMNDVLANICIKEGNYTEADTYLDKAEAYYRENTGDAFLGGEYYIMLSRCKYMFHKGDMEEAQRILEEMIATGDAVYYGLEKDIYDLLEMIYLETGQNEKLTEIYRKLLELDEEFAQTIQREYLEFSEYYRENNLLKERNTILSRTNLIAFFGIIVISAILIIILILLRLLSTKNVTDQLMGTYNRKKLNQLLRRYKRLGTPGNLGVVMMDIDYFKRYNDTYGHLAGDEVLKEVAKVVMGSVRGKDLVIRYGGEELLVLLNGVQAQTAEDICRRIHKQLRERALPHAASEVAEQVTLSIGLCHQAVANSAPLEKLIEYADECLYQSKEAGRNRITAKELK